MIGYQEDGSYIPCPECAWEPPPEPRNPPPGRAVKSKWTWHYSDCPTVPQTTEITRKELQEKLDNINRKIYRYR